MLHRASKKKPWHAELKELTVCLYDFPHHWEPALDFVQQLVDVELTKVGGILKVTDGFQNFQSVWNKVNVKSKKGQTWSWFQAVWREVE